MLGQQKVEAEKLPGKCFTAVSNHIQQDLIFHDTFFLVLLQKLAR